MFTGIVEEKGMIKTIKQNSKQGYKFEITANKILEDIQLGDSISVDGVCLTVTKFTKDSFEVDVMPETVKATTMKYLKETNQVNLERAMLATTRLGGHFVSGHVDGVGEIISKTPLENAIYYQIQLPENLSKYLIHKGSITIDGISLTVFEIKENLLTISLIPHTTSQTTLGSKGIGDLVNIECDLLAKHVEKQLSLQKEINHV
ncbi:MAG TPA: riboflavin synthase [Pseudogracilibacillus sp.]|nr:riboflavin synthase [Pseudogracilibacillus sp.]